MKSSYAGLVAAAIVLGGTAQAQVPVFFALPAGTKATDVTTYNGNVIVVGTESGGSFRWTPQGGKVTIGVSTPANTNVKISTDGSTIVADYAPSSPTQTAIWSGSGITWNPIPSITGGSGESHVGGVSADGSVIVGMSYSSASLAHSYRWTSAGTVDLQFFNSPQSRAWNVSGDGLFVVGWSGGSQDGARWKSPFTSPSFGFANFLYLGGPVGHALSTNANGTIAVGTSKNANPEAWRWDAGPGAGTMTLLPNLPADTTQAYAADLTDDGSLIVGYTLGTMANPGPLKALFWVNGVAQDPETYLTGLGMIPSGYSNYGFATAVSQSGDAIVGYGLGGTVGGAGWVVVSSELLAIGTPFCFGDGSGTACPCAHVGAVGSGCPNGSSASGGKLKAFGDASIANDTLKLKSTQCPPFGPGLYFQGSAQIAGGTSFGNGLLCLTGSTPRLEIRFADSTGTAQTTVSISALGADAIGDVRNYQMWYRDDPSFCPNSGFNLTNAVNLTWNP